MNGVLNEAYQRFHRTGPEWGEDVLTNHGPMAVEVLVRRGHADAVGRWVDDYIGRLDDLPAPSDKITEEGWREALGDGRRVADWTVYFEHRLRERPWREVLATWWPRLLPGIIAGTTHGVIRTGHVVRALLAGAETPATVSELGHALAFWAARSAVLPVMTEPVGTLEPSAALDALPRISSQRGTVATRFGQLTTLDRWSSSIAALRPPENPDAVRTRLADLVAAATSRYLAYGRSSPVLLVHTATAPNAVLHTLPALPQEMWPASLTAVWSAAASIVAAYAPASGFSDPVVTPAGPNSVADILERAIDHGDEHVIKFTDTAAEVYTRTGQTDALAAAAHITNLIPTRSRRV